MDIPYIFLIYSTHTYIYIYISHISYILSIYFPLCFLNLLFPHVKNGAAFLEGFALAWSFSDMMDMSKFRLWVEFRTFRVPNLFFEVIS